MDRNKFLDSAKFLLVFLVVFCHTYEYNLFYDHVKLKIYIYLSTFTIPLFIIISGYFSKNVTWKKYKKFFIQFLLIYLTFQLIYSIPFIVNGKFSLLHFLVPIGPLWYIVGLLLWRFLICVIVKFRLPFIVSFSVAFILSMALGFVQDMVPVSRIFVFIPFFILGYYIPSDMPARIKRINKMYSVMYFVILLVLVVIFGDVACAFTSFGDYPYKEFLSLSHGFFQRLFFFPIAVMSCIAAYNLIPDTFYKLGTASLGILLLYNVSISGIQENIGCL